MNDIRSIHSRENYSPLIDKALNDKRLLKVDRDKIKDLLLSNSDIISEGAASLLERIYQEQNNVKYYQGDDRYDWDKYVRKVEITDKTNSEVQLNNSIWIPTEVMAAEGLGYAKQKVGASCWIDFKRRNLKQYNVDELGDFPDNSKENNEQNIVTDKYNDQLQFHNEVWINRKFIEEKGIDFDKIKIGDYVNYFDENKKPLKAEHNKEIDAIAKNILALLQILQKQVMFCMMVHCLIYQAKNGWCCRKKKH